MWEICFITTKKHIKGRYYATIEAEYWGLCGQMGLLRVHWSFLVTLTLPCTPVASCQVFRPRRLWPARSVNSDCHLRKLDGCSSASSVPTFKEGKMQRGRWLYQSSNGPLHEGTTKALLVFPLLLSLSPGPWDVLIAYPDWRHSKTKK